MWLFNLLRYLPINLFHPKLVPLDPTYSILYLIRIQGLLAFTVPLYSDMLLRRRFERPGPAAGHHVQTTHTECDYANLGSTPWPDSSIFRQQLPTEDLFYTSKHIIYLIILSIFVIIGLKEFIYHSWKNDLCSQNMPQNSKYGLPA